MNPSWGEPIGLSLLRGLFFMSVLASVIPYGSVEPNPFHLAILLHSVVLVMCLFVPIKSDARRRLVSFALLLVIVTAAYVLFQTLNLAEGGLAHPAWLTARDYAGTTEGSISINPAATLSALPALLNPFLVFICALILHQSDESALALWRRLAVLGLSVALFGIVQHFWFPKFLLLDEKTKYVNDVTGTFYNRNTAGTFFGITLLLFFGLIIQYWQMIKPHKLIDRLLSLNIFERDIYGAFFLWILSFFFVSLTLFLTHSRGGMAATFVALMSVTLMILPGLFRNMAAGRRIAAVLAIVVLVLLLFYAFGGQTLLRMERQGTNDDRWCAYASTLGAIRDNFWTGTGFGTFADVFPSYRNEECGLYGWWNRAHDSYLEAFLGLGVFFVFLLGATLIRLGLVFVTGIRERRRFRFVPFLALGMVLLAALHAIVDFSLQIPGFAVFFATALAAAASISLGRSETRLSPSRSGASQHALTGLSGASSRTSSR